MHDTPPAPFLSNWDDIRLFLEVTKSGSFSKAARQLHTTQPTLSRRIESLEAGLGLRLFDRLPGGVALTAEGERIIEAAQRIEDAVVNLQRHALASGGCMEAPVRISLTDGLATFWLAPQLRQLQEIQPAISVEFQCSLEPADLLHMESDLSIRFSQPEAQDLVAARLGTLHGLPWASRDYLERHGWPTSTDDLLRHRLLDHGFYHHPGSGCDAWLNLLRKAQERGPSTNSSASLLSAVQNGVGIALLPTYFCEFAEGILPLDLGLRTRADIWLTYHPNVRGTARVRVVIDWVRSLFDQTAWPWFREAFHAPDPRPITSSLSGLEKGHGGRGVAPGILRSNPPSPART